MQNIVEDSTIDIYFNTVDSTGAAVAPSAALTVADISIYKDGSATQKATTNGLTMTSPFDSEVGLHKLTLDTSNDTGDVGWWVQGSIFKAVLNTVKTSDSVSMDSLIIPGGVFGIEAGANSLTAALPEITSIPAANASLIDKVNHLFALARNEVTQTLTTKTLFADDKITTIGTSTVSVNGNTFTRGEFK